jgi:hypothetical protein
MAMAKGGKNTMRETVVLSIRIHPKLKEAVGRAADADELPMNEWMSVLLARYLKKPNLAKVPRKAFGRPRKDMVEA